MSADAFLDSNVLLYTFDRTDARKRSIAGELVARSIRDGSGAVSWQVVQEVLNVLTRKLRPAMTEADAASYLSVALEPLWVVQPSVPLFRAALELQARYGYSWFDSLIVASALSAGCSRLYTEDLQHGQRIGRLVVENPFRLD